jgi:hypothetical protein
MKEESLRPNPLLRIPPLTPVTVATEFQHEFWRDHSNNSICSFKAEHTGLLLDWICEKKIESIMILGIFPEPR